MRPSANGVSASLHVYPKGGSWDCFGMGKKGHGKTGAMYVRLDESALKIDYLK